MGFDALREGVAALRKPVDSLDHCVESFRHRVHAFAHRVESLPKRVHDLGKPVDAFRKPVDSVSRGVDGLHVRVHSFCKPVDCVSRRVDGLHDRVDALGKPVDGLSKRVDTLLTSRRFIHYPRFCEETNRGAGERANKMSTKPQTPYNGPLVIDVTSLGEAIVDLAPGAMVGMKREKPNFDEALTELKNAKSGAIADAGIALETITRIETRTAKLAELRTKRAEAEKLVEVLNETEVGLENAREGDIALVVKAVQTAAQHIDPGVVASFEATMHYYSQNAVKAVATRRKNAEIKEPTTPGDNDG